MNKSRIPILKTHKLFINGQFPRSESGRYYVVNNEEGQPIANMAMASRKDFRDSVVSARRALSGWSVKTAYNRGQILYRIAEIMENRKDTLIQELVLQGYTKAVARNEIETGIDRIVYYSGWTDKYQQVFSSVNPVAAPYFNFSVTEPVGVVAAAAPGRDPFISLVTMIGVLIGGGNSCIILASENKPLAAISVGEIIHSSDVPAGVVNILTGKREELIEQMASHMDVNAIWCPGSNEDERKKIQIKATDNLKRISFKNFEDWRQPACEDPYLIGEFQEIKTTWHPIGI